MHDFMALLDQNLEYINHTIDDNNGYCYIYVKSKRVEAICPFCNTPSSKVHSIYKKTFQDLPIQGYKVLIILTNRKMFCKNPECIHTTFAERFDFIGNKAKKTKRLEEEIIRLSLNCSSIAAALILKDNTVEVGKSTICQLLKKRRTKNNKT